MTSTDAPGLGPEPPTDLVPLSACNDPSRGGWQDGPSAVTLRRWEREGRIQFWQLNGRLMFVSLADVRRELFKPADRTRHARTRFKGTPRWASKPADDQPTLPEGEVA